MYIAKINTYLAIPKLVHQWMVLFLDVILKYPVKQLSKLELMSSVDFLYRGTLDQ